MSGYSSTAYKKPAHYDEIKTIHLAAKLGILEDVKKFVTEDRSKLTAVEANNTPLYLACLCGHPSVVHYLLTMGARDDAQRRCYTNALTQEVRELLRRFGGENFYASAKDMQSMDAQTMEEAFAALYDSHVATKEPYSSVLSEIKEKTEGNLTKEAIYELNVRRQFSDFKVVAISRKLAHDSSNDAVVSMAIVDEADLLKPQEYCAVGEGETEPLYQRAFYCHLAILISRWKLFRRKYLCDTTNTTISDSELKTMVSQKAKNLQGKALVISGVHPFLVHSVLKFFYSNDFNLASIKDFVLETTTQNVDKKVVYKKAQDAIVLLLKLVTLFGEDNLRSLIMDQCMALNINIDLKKHGVIIDPDNKRKNTFRKKDMAASFKNSVLLNSKIASKPTILESIPEQFRYDAIDYKVQQFGMAAISDISLKAGGIEVPQDEESEAPSSESSAAAETVEKLEQNEASTTIAPTASPILEKMPTTASEQSVPAHKVILSNRCFLFRMIFSGPYADSIELQATAESSVDGRAEFVVAECHHSTLQQLVNFVYSESASFSNENGVEMLFVASRLSMDALKHSAELYVQNKLNEDNYLDLIKVAELTGSNTLLRSALYFTRKFLVLEYWKKFNSIVKSLREMDVSEDTITKLEMAVSDLKPKQTPKPKPVPYKPATNIKISSNIGRKKGRNWEFDE